MSIKLVDLLSDKDAKQINQLSEKLDMDAFGSPEAYLRNVLQIMQSSPSSQKPEIANILKKWMITLNKMEMPDDKSLKDFQKKMKNIDRSDYKDKFVNKDKRVLEMINDIFEYYKKNKK